MALKRDTYKYVVKRSGKVVLRGRTYDFERRVAEHNITHPGCVVEQIGKKVTWQEAEKWLHKDYKKEVGMFLNPKYEGDKTPIEMAREIRLKETQLDTVWSADRENRMIVAGIEKGRQMVIEDGDTYCLDGKKHGRDTNYANVKKRECRQCWQALKGGK